jgi:hypothetical protein
VTRRTPFEFSAAQRLELRKALSQTAIDELTADLASVGLTSATMEAAGVGPWLTAITALLREADAQGFEIPPDVLKWLNAEARWAEPYVKQNDQNRRRARRPLDRALRKVVEALTLRAMERQGLKTGGPVGARVLAIVLDARLGIARSQPPNPDAELQVVMRARRRYQPLTDEQHKRLMVRPPTNLGRKD